MLNAPTIIVTAREQTRLHDLLRDGPCGERPALVCQILSDYNLPTGMWRPCDDRDSPDGVALRWQGEDCPMTIRRAALVLGLTLPVYTSLHSVAELAARVLGGRVVLADKEGNEPYVEDRIAPEHT